MQPITQERLKTLINYDPITGHFTYIKNHSHQKAGDRAGSVTGHGYRSITIDQQFYYEHRLAVLYMTGQFPKQLVDHVNGKSADNRWSNLREATYSQNNCNSRLRKDNTTGVKGVGRTKTGFNAYISFNRTRKYLGTYKTIAEAEVAVTVARKLIHGDFANNNKKD